MSLQYNILWLDDRIEDYQKLGFDTDLKDYVKSLFFDPHIDMFENAETAEQTLKSRKYDVIFSDYNIDEHKDKNGDVFITDIRKQNVNTEVLFYSAQKDLPQMNIDRISFFKLQSEKAYGELEKKMKSVIDLTIEKLNNLTSLRGLVMAEVSELDSLMEEIIINYYSNKIPNSKEWDSFKSHIIKKYVQKTALERIIKGKITQKKEDGSTEEKDCPKSCSHIWMNASTIDEIIFNLDFDSSKKAHTISEIVKTIKLSKDYLFSEYEKEIIQIRNNLAHSKSETQNGKEVLVTKKFGKLVFTQEEFIKIRKNIKKYHELFSELQEKMNAQSQPNSNTGTNQ